MPVVVAELVAWSCSPHFFGGGGACGCVDGQTEKAEAVGYAVVCTLFFRCLADMDFAVCLALLSSRLC